ncbi:DNA-binding transcription factor [Lithospermum erythrorhizon]|uniref:DNA-binding transcription factor n=1 Tax=Lithospermum erythrorhizon TaxID=34254 RepID=A0AAV3PS50_LITER
MTTEHDEDGGATTEEPHHPSLPISRIKRIMKLDKDINKVNSEAAFLITCSTELFLQFLAERSAQVVLERKKKTIKLDHFRVAVKQHQPTNDFLLDCLPNNSEVVPKESRGSGSKKDVGASGSKKIEAFFNKCS